MISYAKALDLLESAATELGVESISSLNALERICAQDIFSPIALPSFDNSAMDGFAVRYNDTL
ncbi:MAG: molybdopterin molybdotransferase, partial [Pseudomonadota bacterium]|nr:molybdopterin molybdotransferase [Pseudomonadota bacterium]